MGIFSKLSGQLIDVIEWTDQSDEIMVYRYPRNDNEIKNGAQLIVRESQVAIMVNEGQLADVFKPGRYTLNTQNLPILTTLQAWQYGFNSPFKAEVYFVNTKQFLNQKWGTSNPVMMRDSEFGVIQLRAFGIYSFSVNDPVTFMREVFGTTAYMKTSAVTEHIRRTLVSGLTDVIAESKIAALDLAANYDELSSFALNTLSSRLSPIGLKLNSFVIENMSLPEEVNRAINQRTSMGIVGDLDQYTKYQTAEAIRDAAKNQNGVAGMGAGFGAAAVMQQVMGGTANTAAPVNTAPNTDVKFCPECGTKLPKTAKFCSACGAKQP